MPLGTKSERRTSLLRDGRRLLQQGIGLAGFTLGQPSLDEVFLALTGHPAEEQSELEATA